MRCRAWLDGTYCRNSTRRIFCYKHQGHEQFPAYLSSLPGIILETVAQYLHTDCIQTLRRTCKHAHQMISRGPFFGSNEHKYFRRLFSKQSVTARQIVQAAQRYEILNKQARDVVRSIPMQLNTVQLLNYSDKCLINRNRKQIKILLCFK